MGQEDTEKISFDCLRTMVDEAIKTKNISIIDKIEKENLRYVQKYAELKCSRDESSISFKSYRIGMYSFILAGVAVGVSYSLVAFTSENLKVLYGIVGVLILIITAWLYLYIDKNTKDFATVNNIKFIHKIILKIEERLACTT